MEVGVLSGSCGNQEDWIETLTYGETCRRRGGKCYFQSTLRWIFDKSRRSSSNERQRCVEMLRFQTDTQGFHLFFHLQELVL